MKKFLIILSLCLLPVIGRAQGFSSLPVIEVCNMGTTHVVFATDIKYMDISKGEYIAAQVVEQSKNMVRMKAKQVFKGETTISVLETNGKLHTFVVRFNENPQSLMIDARNLHKPVPAQQAAPAVPATPVAAAPAVVPVTTETPVVETVPASSTTEQVAAKPAKKGKATKKNSKSLFKVKSKKDTTKTMKVSQPKNSKPTKSPKAPKKPKESSVAVAPVVVPVVQPQEEYGLVVTTGETSNFGKSDAPSLEAIAKCPQSLYHLCAVNSGIEAYCTNIFVYSDLIYLTLEVDNRSNIGYESSECQYSIENIRAKKKYLMSEKQIWPKSTYGSLSCGPKSRSQMVVTLSKFTLMKGTCLRIFIYEKNGTRNLTLTLDAKDINYAIPPQMSKLK